MMASTTSIGWPDAIALCVMFICIAAVIIYGIHKGY